MPQPILPARAALPACTCFRFRKLSRLLTLRYDAALAPAGINVNQFSILRRALARPHSIGSLAAELGMERSTLSRDLRHLRAAGWIRLATGTDARRKSVCVTAEGERVVACALPLWQAEQDALEARLGAADLQRLHAELDLAIDRLAAGA